ncbi:hypothetical protein [Aliivibrio fischeri]|uniref:Uncharacterized protein n=1 Tax=Aliivibrio fischeri TaxID=668 RepID=A0A510UNJ1_ALIFS|nr:hypothetical protein [Aliivibrio fischeri]GEK16217.1 hypothetical protein AFI02nite_42530 [Aliivibrio fischeri]
MVRFDCNGCKLSFSSEAKRNQHQLDCTLFLLKLGPSFRIKMSKKKLRVRASIQGSYEWALRTTLPKNSKKCRLAMDKKYNQADLEKEVIKLEREIALSKSISEKCLNRQIIASHLLKQKIENNSKLKVEMELQKKREIEQKKLTDQAKQDRAQGSALGGIFDNKYSLFVSGGAPGLGKRS